MRKYLVILDTQRVAAWQPIRARTQDADTHEGAAIAELRRIGKLGTMAPGPLFASVAVVSPENVRETGIPIIVHEFTLNLTAQPVLTEGTCRCGVHGWLSLRPGEPFVCLDCRDDESRQSEGWTPYNSRD